MAKLEHEIHIMLEQEFVKVYNATLKRLRELYWMDIILAIFVVFLIIRVWTLENRIGVLEEEVGVRNEWLESVCE